MAIEVYAPGRAELLGNHTDYNQGYVLAIAVERGVTLRGQTRPDDRIILEARDLKQRWEGSIHHLVPAAEGWVNYVTGVVAQFQKRGLKVGGFELSITSDLPMGAGLSSSAALEVSTALFLQTAFQLTIDKLEIAKIAQAAEHEFVGVKCGLLDQMASLFSQAEAVTFLDFRTLTVRNVAIPPGLSFVIANSGVKHALVGGEYNELRENCEAAARALGVPFLREVNLTTLQAAQAKMTPRVWQCAHHIVTENERVLAGVHAWEKGETAAFGELMWGSHESSRVDFHNSCPELDALVTRARQAGAWGARLSGGGFGGATINLVATEKAEALVQALGAECLITRAAAGARVVSA